MAAARDFASYIDDRPADGVFQVDRAVYHDPDVLEAEYRNIFERTWIFLCHDTMVPKAGDFYSTYLGR